MSHIRGGSFDAVEALARATEYLQRSLDQLGRNQLARAEPECRWSGGLISGEELRGGVPERAAAEPLSGRAGGPAAERRSSKVPAHPDDFHERLSADLLRWEGEVQHMYLDTRGLVTVGIGNLVGSVSEAQALPFVDAATGAPATKQQIAEAFRATCQSPAGCRAGAYACVSTLRLPEEFVRALAERRLENEFLPGLRRLFPGFDQFPGPARSALVDMAYNLGVAGLGRFHNLRAACEAGDWEAAAAECRRRTCRAERNDWTKSLFLEAADCAPPTPWRAT